MIWGWVIWGVEKDGKGETSMIGRRVLYSEEKSQEILVIFGRIERFSIYVLWRV